MAGKKILVVGGAGYIGSHMVRLLLEEKYQPVVFDNLSTGHRHFIPKNVPLFKGDLRKKEDLRRCFKKYPIDTVMQFAASIVVPESVSDPLKYYENNVVSTIFLLQEMIRSGVKKLIFSSTAAVYGEPKEVPVIESAETVPTNPYGMSKLMIEKILRDASLTCDFRYISLRYFNVAGSHPSNEIGIDYEVVTHLIPSILKVASGERKEFLIFGDQYPTSDGTCVRDYIYVMDLCRAHLLALKALDRGMKSGVFNLGNGNGFTVKQVLETTERVIGKKIKSKISLARPGDPAKVVASYDKAKKILGWQPQTGLEEIIRTAWAWEQRRKRK